MSDTIRIRRRSWGEWVWTVNPSPSNPGWGQKHGIAMTRKGAERAARKWIAGKNDYYDVEVS